ncbi:unnamed protein product [Prorocentrum cordatum]|uniref:Uncharacterized protein n=1 Tax=Prorocentrum cordatum TaxID=2364126 RepID=A0ABN9SMH2_9DINO|nr:unnamed protein product [Polarella glacialis]
MMESQLDTAGIPSRICAGATPGHRGKRIGPQSKRDPEQHRSSSARRSPRAPCHGERCLAMEPTRAAEADAQSETLAGSDLAGVRSLRDAARAGAGVYWDFAASAARRGRSWQERAPEEVRLELSRDCTEEELQACRAECRIDEVGPAPDGVSPEVLIIIGPSGAGKSMALPKAAELFGLDLSGFAHVDGDDMRSCHGAWKALVVGDEENGYLDAYDIYVSNKIATRTLRKSIPKSA